jgi:hypothetical protein
MSSDFEKALARAAAERSARDEAQMEQEREHAEKLKLAHSIIDPYLADLGPKVVAVLRDLGIPTYYESGIGKYGLGRQTDYWKFFYYRDSDIDIYFTLDDRGVFEQRLHKSYVNALGVGIISGKRILWQESSQSSRTAMTFANLEDRKVYVMRGGTHLNPFLQELSEFIADYIYTEMKV